MLLTTDYYLPGVIFFLRVLNFGHQGQVFITCVMVFAQAQIHFKIDSVVIFSEKEKTRQE